MTRFFTVLLYLLIIVSAVVNSEEQSRNKQLDQLFSQLKQAKSEMEGRAVEVQIWELWVKPDNSELRVLMQKALDAIRWRDFDKAIQLLQQAIDIQPDYAEAWNQKATVYFLKQEYEKALIAVAKALEYEPRHFGALAGRGIIRLRQGRSALAIQNIKAAMKFHPFLKERTIVPQQFLDKQ